MRITSLSRDEGCIGDEVIITGLDLGGKRKVFFNGVSAVAQEKDGTLRTTVPEGAVTGPLSVAGDGDAAEVLFTVLPARAKKEVPAKEVVGHKK